MPMLENHQPNNTTSKIPRDRWALGGASAFFEAAPKFTGQLDTEAITRLFNNPNTTIEETRGNSLKVLFNTGKQIKFIGFVTAADASVDLISEDMVAIKSSIDDYGIIRDISDSELIALF